MKKEDDKKSYQVIVFLLLLSIIFFICYKNYTSLYIGIALALLSLLSKSFTSWFSNLYFLIGNKIGWVTSRIILILIFYVLLTPLAFIKKYFDKSDDFHEGNWKDVKKTFCEDDFKNPW
jgi:predicted membrane protein